MKSSSRRLLGEQEEKTTAQELEEAVCGLCPTLTYKERVMGFAACLTIGLILTCGSLFRLMQLLAGDPDPFVIFYSLGNIVSVCSSFFLSGPWAQVKSMFAPTRAAATIVYLSALGATFFVAFYSAVPGRGPILIVLVVVQFFAMVWYTLSYVPYARQYCKSFCTQVCCTDV